MAKNIKKEIAQIYHLYHYGSSFNGIEPEAFIVADQIIKREWWKYYRERPAFTRIIQSWDTAFKTKTSNDYSVCTTWGEAQSGYYLLDCWRRRVEFPELKRAVVSLYSRDKPQVVVVEDEASGQSLIQELKRETRIPILPIKADKDKVARVNAVSPLIEAGKVYIPESAPWVHEFIEECSSFPTGEHDDQVDTMSQAMSYFGKEAEPVIQRIVYDATKLVDIDF